MEMTKATIPQRTALRHIHPALTIEQQFAPFALLVAWDGMELGTVTTYLAAEQLGRDWLAHLLDEDAMDVTEVHMAQCPHTGWWVMPLDVIESGKPGVVWWMCPACDRDENPRYSPSYNPAHPGPHLLDLTKTAAPALWESRYEEVTR